jgi:hypothetical protein
LRYCFVFQFLFYNVATFTFYFLGSMDHMLSRPSIVGATNKDSISISRCTAFYDMAKFNMGSWGIALALLGLAYATVIQEYDWDVTQYPNEKSEYLQHALFAGPAIFLALMAFFVPIILNPWILGWPFLRKKKPKKIIKKAPMPSTQPKRSQEQLVTKENTVDLPTMMKLTSPKRDVDTAIIDTQDDLDMETGSLTTNDLRTQQGTPSPAGRRRLKRIDPTFGPTWEDEKKEQFPTPPTDTDRIRSRVQSTSEHTRKVQHPSSSLSLEDPDRQKLRPSKSTLSWEEPRSSALSPVRRLQQSGVSPGRPQRSPAVSRSPPHSPVVQREHSRSPGRQRSAGQLQRHTSRSPNAFAQSRSVQHDKWGFPIYHTSAY